MGCRGSSLCFSLVSSVFFVTNAPCSRNVQIEKSCSGSNVLLTYTPRPSAQVSACSTPGPPLATILHMLDMLEVESSWCNFSEVIFPRDAKSTPSHFKVCPRSCRKQKPAGKGATKTSPPTHLICEAEGSGRGVCVRVTQNAPVKKNMGGGGVGEESERRGREREGLKADLRCGTRASLPRPPPHTPPSCHAYLAPSAVDIVKSGHPVEEGSMWCSYWSCCNTFVKK